MIGIFGGTFDPIHYGHIHLAQSLAQKYSLEEVWFLLAKKSPLKNKSQETPFDHRAAMVALAIEDIPNFFLVVIEKDLPSPSYTVDTLRFIQQKEHRPLALILGQDAAVSLPQWKEPEEICQRATLLVGGRPASPPIGTVSKHPILYKAIQNGWTQIPLKEISATHLRERFHQGESCDGLLPPKVVDYIYKNELYSCSIK